MLIKYLESLKNSNLDDTEIEKLILSSYSFYIKNSNRIIDSDIASDLNKQKIFSSLLRFFRSFNTNKKLDEEALQLFMKEALKGKSKAVAALTEKITEIIAIQTKRNNFSDQKLTRTFNYIISKPKLSQIGVLKHMMTRLKNFSFKVSVTISNIYSNRLLSPEILFYFTTEEGKTFEMRIDMKIFQDLRKCVAFHVKKMIDNESVSLLK